MKRLATPSHVFFHLYIECSHHYELWVSESHDLHQLHSQGHKFSSCLHLFNDVYRSEGKRYPEDSRRFLCWDAFANIAVSIRVFWPGICSSNLQLCSVSYDSTNHINVKPRNLSGALQIWARIRKHPPVARCAWYPPKPAAVLMSRVSRRTNNYNKGKSSTTKHHMLNHH